MDEAVGRTSSAAAFFKDAGGLGAFIAVKVSEEIEFFVIPYVFEFVAEDIAEPEFGFTEEEVAWIHGAVGHDP